jgi:hypothetical protein
VVLLSLPLRCCASGGKGEHDRDEDVGLVVGLDVSGPVVVL